MYSVMSTSYKVFMKAVKMSKEEINSMLSKRTNCCGKTVQRKTTRKQIVK